MPVATGLTNGIDKQDGSSKRSSAAVKKHRFLVVVVAIKEKKQDFRDTIDSGSHTSVG